MSRITTDVGRAAEVLAGGGVVAIPTETVYGLAADADQPAAVERIFAIKGRPADHPLIVHLAGAEVLDEWAAEVPEPGRILAATCWPGPLTMVLRRRPRVSDLVTGGRDTVGVRVPAHPMTAQLLAVLGRGLAAPSANPFGRVSPTTAAHVAADLGDAVDLILDGGACEHGVESTIVDCTVSPPQILRAGAITAEQITALAGPLGDRSGPARAPGMLKAHYAPRTPLFVVDSGIEAELLSAGLGRTRTIGTPDDLVGYARNLYAWLRAADAEGLDALIALRPTAHGLGHAIRDRLAKAGRGSGSHEEPRR